MNNTLVTVDEYGNKRWTLNGKMHRVEGPAFENSSGFKAWYQCGKLHRIDGAAIEGIDGTKSWYVNGTKCLTIEYWAAKALAYENKAPTQDAIDDKVMQVMQQDLFS